MHSSKHSSGVVRSRVDNKGDGASFLRGDVKVSYPRDEDVWWRYNGTVSI